METCRVLRCANESATVWGFDLPGLGRRELAVCAGHERALRAGESRQYDTDDDAIVMGADLALAAPRFLTGFKGRLFGDTELSDGTGHEMLLELTVALDPGMGQYGLPLEQSTMLVPASAAKNLIQLLTSLLADADAVGR